MINPMELTGKQILVAGATSEQGQAIVTQLVRLGARVVMTDNSENLLIEIKENIGNSNLYFRAFDIYENSIIEDNFRKISKEYGAFDGFVFCAGIGGVRPVSFTNYSFTHEMMNANLYSFIEMVRCITRKNCFKQGGSIVAISSVSSIKGLKSKTAYAASKAALDAAVRCIAAEFGEKGIRVNTIIKGWVKSDMEKDFIKTNMELSETDDFKRQFLGVIYPSDIANAVSFLLSDATRKITGVSLVLDGGYTL
jgi:NAD(P)-dependent dehydrogenase (short-subunit alcohol dehydrogenase family)